MTLVFKIVLLGDSQVGKTSVLRRFLGEQFDPIFIPTTPGHETVNRKIIDVQGHKVQLVIWDSPGGEAFRTVSATYLNDVKCVMVMFDVSKEDSFRNVKNWISVVDCHTEKNATAKIIIGNKTDKNRCISIEQAQSVLASSAGSC